MYDVDRERDRARPGPSESNDDPFGGEPKGDPLLLESRELDR